MPEIYTILTPLPQLDMKKPIPYSAPNTLRKEGLSFSPMTPKLYRGLVNLVKEHKCTEDIITLLQEAGAVFWAQLPHPWPMKSSPVVSGGYYTMVADAILKRFFDCFLLFGYVPKPFRRSFWFAANGPPEKIDIKSVKLLEPDWNYYDWETKYSEAAQADVLVIMLQMFFNKLCTILGIKRLNAAFTDQNKQKGYLAAGNKNIHAKTEELLKLRYGPDAHFVEDDLQGEIDLKPEASKILPPLSSPKLSAKWCLEGYNRAYFNEIEKLDRKLYRESSGLRLLRAFQFFSNGYRLENPHRFVALMTSLEALFCTKKEKITFQLSSRISKFLNPNDLNEKKQLSSKVEDLYDIRSQIVHGHKYNTNRIERGEEDLIDLVRRVFWKILSDEKIFNLFFSKNQNDCNEYLEGLNLGEVPSK